MLLRGEAKTAPESSFGEVPRGGIRQEVGGEPGFCSTGRGVEKSCRKSHI